MLRFEVLIWIRWIWYIFEFYLIAKILLRIIHGFDVFELDIGECFGWIYVTGDLRYGHELHRDLITCV